MQLTEKLAQAESELEMAKRSKEEMQVEMEAKIAARGAGIIQMLSFPIHHTVYIISYQKFCLGYKPFTVQFMSIYIYFFHSV